MLLDLLGCEVKFKLWHDRIYLLLEVFDKLHQRTIFRGIKVFVRDEIENKFSKAHLVEAGVALVNLAANRLERLDGALHLLNLRLLYQHLEVLLCGLKVELGLGNRAEKLLFSATASTALFE